MPQKSVRLLLLGLCLAALPFGSSSSAEGETEHTGQIVCSSCWFEADRTRLAYGSEENLACAARCAAQGIPVALAVLHPGEEPFALLELRGDPEGAASDWLEIVGRFARVSGRTKEVRGKTRLRVTSVELLDETPWNLPGLGAGKDDAHVHVHDHGHDHGDAHEEAGTAKLEWTDLDGHTQSIESLRGRIVVLNFWATWCAPCAREMPDLVRVQNRFGMHGVQVVGAAADTEEHLDHVLQFARKHRINFPLMLGSTTAQMESLDLGQTLPATAILDREGKVVRRIVGVFERRELERDLEQLIGGATELASTAHGHGHEPRSAPVSHASLVPS